MMMRWPKPSLWSLRLRSRTLRAGLNVPRLLQPHIPNLLEEYRAVERKLLQSVLKWAARREAITSDKAHLKSQ